MADAWAKRREVFERYERASEIEDLHIKFYAARGSALCQLFKPRESDWTGNAMLARRLRITMDGFYTKRSIDLLRKVAATPSAHQPRANEIVWAYDAYGTHYPEHVAATAALEAVTAELHVLDDAIRDMPALSLEGIGIKASWALTHTAEGERDLSEILRQVEAFAHRHRGPARRADAVSRERDVMGGLPAADWALQHLFMRWAESAIDVRQLEAEEEQAFRQHGGASEAWQKAEALATAESVRNEALRVGIVDMPAASLQGVQLKAHVYQWLCQTAEGGIEDGLAEARKGGRADDAVLAYAIARDMARLGPAACLSGPPEVRDASIAINQERAA
ncbi:hypothetical protein P7D22_13565 [Lichenihabitans sp. Uapishka_5]|uniref:hypothetical protein n=1 Tax=Lichenihabitans sp. Uapishka_5 TaxID=3037302 RepID=UPI0029E81FDC|nr:hypothetical protein [Lichenihabitans sp. Uapishka_5]MDX7952203.1 hypothetical protein [Lichenihabitans sp. Uapishka_5]